MPPLQVKDFPADTYERLRACAAEENRSISQQTLTIIQQFLDERDAQKAAEQAEREWLEQHGLDHLEIPPNVLDASRRAAAPRQDPPLHIPPRQSMYARVDDGIDYRAKHRRVLERIRKMHEEHPIPELAKLTSEEIVAMIHEDREERKNQIMSNLSFMREEAEA